MEEEALRTRHYFANGFVSAIGVGVALLPAPGLAGGGADPWADEVVAYVPGGNPLPGFKNPQTLLGAPERYTGEFDFNGKYASAVTVFNTAFGSDEILSVGAGGSVTVRFDEPITDDPSHLFGVDFILFGNGSFSDDRYPDGLVGGLFNEGPFSVSVSADGVNFVEVGAGLGDGIWPAEGWLDLASPYSPEPGQVPSDFLKPLDPALTMADFLGKTYAEVKAIYDGSGGGLPLDISGTGIGEAYFVRIDVAEDALSAPEFDAFAVVPEPSTTFVLVVASFVLALRSNKGKGGQHP